MVVGHHRSVIRIRQPRKSHRSGDFLSGRPGRSASVDVTKPTSNWQVLLVALRSRIVVINIVMCALLPDVARSMPDAWDEMIHSARSRIDRMRVTALHSCRRRTNSSQYRSTGSPYGNGNRTKRRTLCLRHRLPPKADWDCATLQHEVAVDARDGLALAQLAPPFVELNTSIPPPSKGTITVPFGCTTVHRQARPRDPRKPVRAPGPSAVARYAH